MRVMPSSVARNIQGVLKERLCLEVNPLTIPRRLQDSPSYDPWWRVTLASHYVKMFLSNPDDAQGMDLIASEPDIIVRNLFTYLAHGTCLNREATRHIRWSIDVHNNSPINAAKIRAMLFCNIDPAFIAKQFDCETRHIEMYEKIFFDVAHCAISPVWRDSFITPEVSGIAKTMLEAYEAATLIMACRLTPEMLMYFLTGQLAEISSDLLEKMRESLEKHYIGASLLHSFSRGFDNFLGDDRSLSRAQRFEEQRIQRDIAKSQQGGNVDKFHEWFGEAEDRGIIPANVVAISRMPLSALQDSGPAQRSFSEDPTKSPFLMLN